MTHDAQSNPGMPRNSSLTRLLNALLPQAANAATKPSMSSLAADADPEAGPIQYMTEEEAAEAESAASARHGHPNANADANVGAVSEADDLIHSRSDPVLMKRVKSHGVLHRNVHLTTLHQDVPPSPTLSTIGLDVYHEDTPNEHYYNFAQTQTRNHSQNHSQNRNRRSVVFTQPIDLSSPPPTSSSSSSSRSGMPRNLSSPSNLSSMGAPSNRKAANLFSRFGDATRTARTALAESAAGNATDSSLGSDAAQDQERLAKVQEHYEGLLERVRIGRAQGPLVIDDATLVTLATHAFYGVGPRQSDVQQAQTALTHAAQHPRATILCRADLRQPPLLLVRQALMEHTHGNLERANALYMLASTQRPDDPVPLLGLRLLHLERPSLAPAPRHICIPTYLHQRLSRLFAIRAAAIDIAHHAALADANPIAACIVATCHYWGWGVPVDKRRAVAWLRKAASRLSAASVALGMLLLAGDKDLEKEAGLNQDVNGAVDLFRKAADAGHAAAQVNLGMAYYLGVGAPQSDEQAVAWFKKGADSGDDRGFEYLAYCAVEGRGLEKSTLQALEYMQRALDNGSPIAPSWIRKHNARHFFQPNHVDSYCALQ